MIRQFTKFGYSYGHAVSLSATYAVQAITADTTNSSRCASIPNDAYIESVEFEISSIASSASKIKVYLARDSAGDVPFTSDKLAGAEQTITTGLATATDGAVVWTINKDYHYDSDVAATTSGTIYVVAKTDTGTCTANIRVNWRA
jgi:hypothetical protein